MALLVQLHDQIPDQRREQLEQDTVECGAVEVLDVRLLLGIPEEYIDQC